MGFESAWAISPFSFHGVLWIALGSLVSATANVPSIPNSFYSSPARPRFLLLQFWVPPSDGWFNRLIVSDDDDIIQVFKADNVSPYLPKFPAQRYFMSPPKLV